jgi:hypothetical protein
MEGHYPVSVITDGVGLNITVMSYMDHVDFGVVVDHDMVDDAWTFMESMGTALEDLKAAVLPQRPAKAAT